MQATWQPTDIVLTATMRALSLFQGCVDFAPELAELLMRMAEMHHLHGEHQMAHGLFEIIIDMPIAPQADYVEPALYQHRAQLLLSETPLSTQNHQSLHDTLQTLHKIKGLTADVYQRIGELARLSEGAMTEKSSIPHRRLASVEADIDTSIITIGMATHDDFDGVYFSIMSLVLY
ncbi:MAG: hypothetical protein ACI9WC_003563, partial [Arenicella sp.]